jgi:putative hydrolase of the HAD superfamily
LEGRLLAGGGKLNVRRITCLMLDMGGVLTLEQRIDKVDEMMGILGLGRGRDDGTGDGLRGRPGVAREDFHQAYFAERNDYDRGSIDGEGYWRRVASALGAEIGGEASLELVRADLESWFNRREGMFELLGGIRGRVGRLVLLSNIHADGARYLREGEGSAWAAHFDELVLSCEHRILKPERAIYELALDLAGALPSETLFVDDNEANVEGARAAGLSSFRFTSEADFAATLEREYELSR